ncbi:MAG: MaoC family dehydratase N-terminal domain-containing protein [Rhizomicrobium sp.]|jgi:3-methylfumaryl-CoA hydratase
MNIDHLRQWIGRSETAEDVASEAPLAGLAALLDRGEPWRDVVPPLAHWLYFLTQARQSEIDVDGHPRRGGFLPPVDLPRRMWAGGRLSFDADIPIGAAIARRSTIADVTAKTGSTGNMVFVTVRHEIVTEAGIAIREEQDIVYREAPKPGARTAADNSAAKPCEHVRTVTPDPTQLFRFSALTFNAHRIHYDRDYCCDVEGYPGLVVQGPFTAMLLMDHLTTCVPGARVRAFKFRAQSPLFDTAPFELCLNRRGAELWAQGPHGTAMVAEAELA